MVNKLNIFISGSDGQLARCLQSLSMKYIGFNFIFKNKHEIDITNFNKLYKELENNNIDVFINCAAYTNVLDSEINREIAKNVNFLGAVNVAKICSILNIKLVHISTDFVFNGKKQQPYKENDSTDPLNYYGETKLNAENEILSLNLKNSVIIRTSWLYSHFGTNFLSKILLKTKNYKTIKVVDNEIGSPTNAIDLAEIILDILPKIKNEKTELFHYSNLGFCSRYEFAVEIFKLIKIDKKIKINKVNFNCDKIKRPGFSALCSKKIINKYKVSVKKWEDSLKCFINENFDKLGYGI